MVTYQVLRRVTEKKSGGLLGYLCRGKKKKSEVSFSLILIHIKVVLLHTSSIKRDELGVNYSYNYSAAIQ